MLAAAPLLSSALHTAGLALLPASERVPLTLLLRPSTTDAHPDPRLLRLTARGTTVRLEAYDAADLTVALLRAECDCQEHRAAGAAYRSMLAPGAVPTSSVAIDGTQRFGWRAIEAAMLGPDDVAPLLVELLDRLPQSPVATGRAGSATHPLHDSGWSAASMPSEASTRAV